MGTDRDRDRVRKGALTSDLFDTLEGVFEGIEGAGVALGLAFGGQTQLQLFDGLHQLLLGLDPG